MTELPLHGARESGEMMAAFANATDHRPKKPNGRAIPKRHNLELTNDSKA